jgi:hypothetical protein
VFNQEIDLVPTVKYLMRLVVFGARARFPVAMLAAHRLGAGMDYLSHFVILPGKNWQNSHHLILFRIVLATCKQTVTPLTVSPNIISKFFSGNLTFSISDISSPSEDCAVAGASDGLFPRAILPAGSG